MRAKILTALSAAVSLATLLALLAPTIPPDTWWPPIFLAYGYVYLLYLNVVLLLFWLGSTGKGRWITIVTLLLCLPTLGRHLRFGSGADEAPGKAVTVATFNTKALQRLWKGRRGEMQRRVDRELIATLFPQDDEPYILCLQEVPVVYRLNPADWGMSGARVHRFRNTAIISRYPVLRTGKKAFEGSGNAIVWADVKVNGGKVRVYGIHLQSTRISGDTEKLLDAPVEGKKTWLGLRSVLGRVKRATALRAEQARWLAGHIADCELPVIVAGDLNDTPQSYVYRTISEGLEDSFLHGGTGFGTTYGGVIPGLRIDHILGGKGVRFLEHRVHGSDLSDHYPVSAEFVLE